MVYMVFTVLGLPGSGFQPLSHKTAKKSKNRITKPYNITFNGIYDLYVFFCAVLGLPGSKSKRN